MGKRAWPIECKPQWRDDQYQGKALDLSLVFICSKEVARLTANFCILLGYNWLVLL